MSTEIGLERIPSGGVLSLKPDSHARQLLLDLDKNEREVVVLRIRAGLTCDQPPSDPA